MEVDTVRFPGDMYEVLKWAVNRQLKEIPTEFEAWLLGLMPEKCREVTGHHLNVHTPQTPCVDGWVKGYPHSHVWSVNWPPDTYTCVTCLTMSDEGGEVAFGGDIEEIRRRLDRQLDERAEAAADEEWECSGMRSWECGELPRRVETAWERPGSCCASLPAAT